MDLGIVVIVIMAILLVFHLVFFKLTQDDTNQFIIYGIFVCYSLCILLEKGATSIPFFNNQPVLISHGLISLALILGVQYVSNLMDNRIFRRMTKVIQAIDILIFIITAILTFAKVQNKFFFIAMVLLCVVSLAVYVFFLVRCWADLPPWYQMLLCAMLFMVFCFTMLLFFDVLDIRYAYYWAIGFIVYVVVYEIFSVWKVVEDISLLRRMKESADEPANQNEIHWTRAEQAILSEMAAGNTESKAIATNLDKSTATIDTQIRTMLKKSGLTSRIDLARIYGIK